MKAGQKYSKYENTKTHFGGEKKKINEVGTYGQSKIAWDCNTIKKPSFLHRCDLFTETVEVCMVKTTNRREHVTFQNCQFQQAVEKKEMKISNMCLFVDSCGSKDAKSHSDVQYLKICNNKIKD